MGGLHSTACQGQVYSLSLFQPKNPNVFCQKWLHWQSGDTAHLREVTVKLYSEKVGLIIHFQWQYIANGLLLCNFLIIPISVI